MRLGEAKGALLCMYTGERTIGGALLDDWPAPLSRIPVFVREERRSRTLDKILQDVTGILQQDGIIGWTR